MLHFTCVTSCFIWIYWELYHWLKWKFQWQGKPEFWLIINVDIWNYPRDVTYRSSTSWSVETLQLMYETGIMPWYKWIVIFYISWIYCRASKKIYKHNFGDGRFGSWKGKDDFYHNLPFYFILKCIDIKRISLQLTYVFSLMVGGWLCPHFIQTAISPWNRGMEVSNFLDLIMNFQKITVILSYLEGVGTINPHPLLKQHSEAINY